MTRKPVWFLAVLFLAYFHLAHAQQAGKVPRIGVLVSTSGSIAKPRLKAFQDGLRELGYVEGKNIVLELRSAEGRPETLPKRVDELVQLNVDVIVTETSNATQAAKKATTTIPVVFATANDPVGDGHVASLARPGGNITGFSNLAPELNGKKLELLKEAVFRVTGVAFLLRWGTSIGEQRFNETEIAAKDLGLRLLPLSAKGNEDLESAFGAVKSAGAEALIVSPSTFSVEHRRRLIELTAKYRLPAIYPSPLFVEAGGLMSYGPDSINNWRRATIYVDKILKGIKPAELPVEQPTKFEFSINLKTAKQIGLTIPPSVLARADRVIK
ncbi:MAG TPA: ABC transporter substrate-binding protein [Candidatus Binatia bacterium]|nr:ABC transporter substrate-binding protein [Candidatus Binatia bacterium]